MQTKRCSRCKADLNTTKFNKDSSRRDGLYAYCRDCQKQKNAKQYDAHREERLADAATYRERHRTELRQKATVYNAIHAQAISCKMTAHRRANPKRTKEIQRRYRVKNRAKILDRIHVRRARIRNNGPVENISRREVWERDGGKCRWCGNSVLFENMHLDHVVPVCAGGTHTYGNVTTSCKKCNLRKGAKEDV